MRDKSNYLVWRERNGFFIALDKVGRLSTWSMITGALLDVYDSKLDVKNFEVASSV